VKLVSTGPTSSFPFPEVGRGRGRGVNASELATVLDQFAATVIGDFALTDILRQLALGATRVLHISGAGVTSPGPEGELLRMVFTTSAAVQALERIQEMLQKGPCQDCYDAGRVINLAELSTEGTWPDYQRRAEEVGIRAVTAIPLQARGRRWGVLAVYRSEPLALSVDELAAATTLAHLATSYLVVAEDRDAARRAEQALSVRAMRDALTGLPVRWVFLEHLEHALARLHRASTYVAVLFIDLDGLKYVNDTYGHAAGDALLSTCGERIRAALRPSDVLARIGGDEFVVLIEETHQRNDAVGLAQRIVDSLAAPYRSGRHVIRPSASIGIALTDDPATPAATLVAHADSAMYQAKRSGRGGVRVFDPVGYATARADAATQERHARELQTALENDELLVHYQPIFELSGEDEDQDVEKMYAVEALVRWRHPREGLLTAGAFIDAAERGGLLPEMGASVLRQACQRFSAWRDEMGDVAPGRLFVNLSPSELVDQRLVDGTTAALADAGLAPSCLTIEVTESALMQQVGVAVNTLAALRELGCEIAIDDFGTGYSSLSRLIEIPATTIKIGRSFTSGLTGDTGAAAVISAVHSLGQSLGRVVIAEGIESYKTVQALRALGIRYVQGFYLAVPMSADALLDRLRAGGSGTRS
jgi:diguanylate cyclase (GGDEF)-like protein